MVEWEESRVSRRILFVGGQIVLPDRVVDGSFVSFHEE